MTNEPIFPERPTFQRHEGPPAPLQSLIEQYTAKLTPQERALVTMMEVMHDTRTDEEIVGHIECLLQGVAFKGTIHQIRELVNDQKWDDKV